MFFPYFAGKVANIKRNFFSHFFDGIMKFLCPSESSDPVVFENGITSSPSIFQRGVIAIFPLTNIFFDTHCIFEVSNFSISKNFFSRNFHAKPSLA